MKMFIVSDIHGMYKEFKEILTNWNREDTLVVLGDMIDRGPKSLKVIRKVMRLTERHPDKVLSFRGNHEDLFLNFINNTDNLGAGELYYHCGKETIKQLMKKAKDDTGIHNYEAVKATIKRLYAREIDFLNKTLYYKIIGKVLLTHAGFESESKDLTDTSEDDFLWIREHYKNPNLTDYVNVFGHTPTHKIHKSDDIWISKDNKYIAIDGGCSHDGQLNAVLIDDGGNLLETYKVK